MSLYPGQNEKWTLTAYIV